MSVFIQRLKTEAKNSNSAKVKMFCFRNLKCVSWFFSSEYFAIHNLGYFVLLVWLLNHLQFLYLSLKLLDKYKAQVKGILSPTIESWFMQKCNTIKDVIRLFHSSLVIPDRCVYSTPCCRKQMSKLTYVFRTPFDLVYKISSD